MAMLDYYFLKSWSYQDHFFEYLELLSLAIFNAYSLTIIATKLHFKTVIIDKTNYSMGELKH